MGRALLPALLLLLIAPGCPAPEPVSHPLYGLHRQLDCADCHPSGQDWDDVPTECHDCHGGIQPAWHFEPSCADCHDPTGWPRVDVPRRRHYPLPHSDDAITECGACHVADRQDTCEVCHSRPTMDDVHWRVPQYEVDLECLYCH